MDRWKLPGPAGFIDNLMASLRDGASVVVGATSTSHAALAYALEDQVANEWRLTGPLGPSELSPLDQLYDELDVADEPGSRRSIAALIGGIESKRLILVTSVDPLRWPAWQRFLEEYAHTSRSLSAFDRSQLLIVTTGIPRNRLPQPAPALATWVWDGVVGEADVFSYVVQSWRQKGRPVDATAKLVARIITRLALWDFDLTDRLLERDPRDLFDPIDALRVALDGLPALQQVEAPWELGGAAEFDGEQRAHSAMLLQSGDKDSELSMRLWAAQASEILPALEIGRRMLADRMKDARLKLPVTLNGELIHDLLDVEIGPLHYLAKVHRLPPDIVRLAEKYKDLRNKLAHLCPLTADEAMDPEVLAPRRRNR